MRTAIVKAVQDFFASRVDESEVKTLMYEAVQQINKSNKNKIDTSCLARNFEQREYSKEFIESLYKNFEPATSSPAPSTPTKDIVMEQVRAMRDSLDKNGRIKPLPCVNLW